MPSADDATLPAPGLVIFDCDGVLVDSERISHLVLQAMPAEHGALLAALTTPRCVASNGPRWCSAAWRPCRRCCDWAPVMVETARARA